MTPSVGTPQLTLKAPTLDLSTPRSPEAPKAPPHHHSLCEGDTFVPQSLLPQGPSPRPAGPPGTPPESHG